MLRVKSPLASDHREAGIGYLSALGLDGDREKTALMVIGRLTDEGQLREIPAPFATPLQGMSLMSTVIPDDYHEIDRIEIYFRSGDKVALYEDDARQWAQAVDWGLRRFQLEQFDKYQKIVKNFEWEEI